MTRASLGDEGMEAKTSLQLAFPKIDPVQNRKDLTPGPSLEKSDHAQGKFAISFQTVLVNYYRVSHNATSYSKWI